MRRKSDPSNKPARFLRRLGNLLKRDHRVTQHHDGFTLLRSGMTTRVSVVPPPDYLAPVLSGFIRIESPLPLPEGASDVDEVLAVANSLTLLAAFYRDAEGEGRALTMLPLLRGYEEVTFEVDPDLITTAALLQSPSFAFAVGRVFDGERPELPDAAAAPSRWTAEDFATAVADLRDRFNVRLDGTAIDFEVPFGHANAPLAVAGINTVPHALHGNGLHYALILPIEAPIERAAELCRELNGLERDTGCGAPLLGAWAAAPDDTVVHTGFFPNVLYDPSLLTRLPYWMALRATWAAKFVEVA